MKQEIINECADLFGVDAKDLVSPSRLRHLSKARFALYKALHLRGWSSARIGRAVGDRDHSTVLYGLKRADYWIEKDPRYARRVQRLVEWRPKPINPAYLPPEPEPESEPEPENILKDFLYD